MSVRMIVAPDFASYPRLRGLAEPDLIPVIRVEFCACGEYVRQLVGDSIPEVVRRHNATLPHRAWRYQADPLPDPTVVPGAVDVSNVPAMRPVGERQR